LGKIEVNVEQFSSQCHTQRGRVGEVIWPMKAWYKAVELKFVEPQLVDCSFSNF